MRDFVFSFLLFIMLNFLQCKLVLFPESKKDLAGKGKNCPFNKGALSISEAATACVIVWQPLLSVTDVTKSRTMEVVFIANELFILDDK